MPSTITELLALEQQRESLERRAHRTVLSALLGPGYASVEEAEARARELGVPIADRRLMAVVIRLGGGAATGLAVRSRALEVAEAAAATCRSRQLPALIASLGDSRVGMLLALPADADPDLVLVRLASQLEPHLGAQDVIGSGSVVRSLAATARSFLDADEVAEAAVRELAASLAQSSHRA
jgi:purine catabolism regulator